MVKIAASLVLGVCTLGLLGLSPKPRVHAFSELPKGNVLKVHFQSSGCFNLDTYDFTFRGSERPTVDLVEWDSKDGQRSFPREALTDEDVRNLDQLLKYYRAVKAGDCTTLDTVEISELCGKQVIASETYQDRTCGLWDDKTYPLSLQVLSARIEHANDQAKP